MMPMWPEGAPPDYVEARIELARAERVLRDRIEEIAAARRRLPLGALVTDHLLAEGPFDMTRDDDVRMTRISELFGEHDTLFMYHLMFHPDDDSACPMCSMWLDGFHGVAHHLERHASFAVVAKAPLPKLRAWSRRRGWSACDCFRAYRDHVQRGDGGGVCGRCQRPMASVFVRDGARVRHFYTIPANFLDDTQRSMDLLSPVWNVLDLLPAVAATGTRTTPATGRRRSRSTPGDESTWTGDVSAIDRYYIF